MRHMAHKSLAMTDHMGLLVQWIVTSRLQHGQQHTRPFPTQHRCWPAGFKHASLGAACRARIRMCLSTCQGGDIWPAHACAVCTQCFAQAGVAGLEGVDDQLGLSSWSVPHALRYAACRPSQLAASPSAPPLLLGLVRLPRYALTCTSCCWDCDWDCFLQLAKRHLHGWPPRMISSAVSFAFALPFMHSLCTQPLLQHTDNIVTKHGSVS
jgi:hypothetical protein